MSGTSAGSSGGGQPVLETILEALCEGAPVAIVDTLIERAVHAGELTAEGDGAVLVPRRATAGARLLPPVADWCATGFVPLLVKPTQVSATRGRALRAVFAALRNEPTIHAPPHWATGRAVVTLYLPEAVDLRLVAGPTELADARAVHDVCMDWLGRFVSVDQRLRRAMRESGARPPQAFPVARRYTDALATAGPMWGADTVSRLAAVAPPEVSGWPRVLFADPKPANFVVRRLDRHRVANGVRPYRVDLDMLHLESPLSLQVVLAFLAHPVAFEVAGDPPERFAHAHARIRSSCAEFGIAQQEVDGMIWYHLVRNVVSAVAAGDRVKATSMGQVLAAAAAQLPRPSRDPALAGRLRRWVALPPRPPAATP